MRDGVPYEEVMEQVTAPVAVAEPEQNLDSDDWPAAVDRSQTVVITDDESLQSILEEGDFGRWKVFLHPTQEKLVRRRYSGPARVGGGPGTGRRSSLSTASAIWCDNFRPATRSPCSSPPSTATSPRS